MSYILDALKKAEKERKQGTLPDMLTVQDIVAEKPKKRLPGVYILVAALVLNAGILVWWLGYSHTSITKVSQTATATRTSAVPANEPAKAIPEVPASPSPVPTISPETSPIGKNIVPFTGKPAPAMSETKSDRPKEMPAVTDVRSKSVAAHPSSDSDSPKPDGLSVEKPKRSEGTGQLPPGPAGDFTEMPEENKIYKLAELPASIRQGLPSFSVTALLYSSSPSSRMARVNDQMMREGQDIAAGVRLEEITRDGLVCSYRKFRFYVGAK